MTAIVTDIHKQIISDIKIKTKIDLELAENVIKIIEEVRKFKSENKLSMKDIILEVKINGNKEAIRFIKSVEYDVKAVCSIENLQYEDGEEFKVVIIWYMKYYSVPYGAL